MKIVVRQAAGGDPCPEGVHTFTLKDLRGPTSRDYTTDDEDVHIEQSFRAGAQVVDGPHKGMIAWDTVDADGPMGWRFAALADACLARRHKEGEDIDTEKLIGRTFIATVKHAPGSGGGVFTNLQRFAAVGPVAKATTKPKASLAKAAKRSR